MIPSIVLLGNLLVDDVVFADGTTRMGQAGGALFEACLQRAVVTASFAVAGWGPEALLTATRADAEARWRQWYGCEEQR